MRLEIIRIILIAVYFISELMYCNAKSTARNAFDGDLYGHTGTVELELRYSIPELIETKKI